MEKPGLSDFTVAMIVFVPLSLISLVICSWLFYKADFATACVCSIFYIGFVIYSTIQIVIELKILNWTADKFNNWKNKG